MYESYADIVSRQNHVISAFCILTGIDADVIENLVTACDTYDIDLDCVLANNPEIYNFRDSEECKEELFNIVGNEIKELVNDNISDCLGVDEFISGFEISDELNFSFKNIDELKSAIRDNPDGYRELDRSIRKLIDEVVDVKSLLESKTRSNRR